MKLGKKKIITEFLSFFTGIELKTPLVHRTTFGGVGV
jgi:hypothetical protein